ncbi:MAG: serine hydrolase, partial [Pirellula sp.]
MSDYADGPEIAWQRICELKLSAPIGNAFKYSDVNFIVLGKIVEKVSGQSLDAYTRDAIFNPLGMKETGFNPDPELRARAAPTEKRQGEWIQGYVHDPRAHALGGIAGHAGLFSTARDMAIYARMMLHQGHLPNAPTPTLATPTVRSMTAAYRVPSGFRGLGWDKQTGFSTNRGDLLSHSAFGHGGFTGTVLWIDPELDLYFIFLSNRVHPSGDGSVNTLAGRIANLVAATYGKAAQQATRLESVLTGIDTLEQENFRSLQDSNIGVITNHTGRNASGTSTAEILSRAPGVQLKALFSPEHGFEGILDTAKINDATDTKTGLRIYSLYGETRRPTLEMLEGIDTLVFDIQDIGTRFYT